MNFNDEILQIWKDNKSDLIKWYENENVLAPMLYPKLTTNGFLTIGINPSFSQKKICELMEKYSKVHLEKLRKSNPNLDFWEHYSFVNWKKNYKDWIEYEKTARSKYPYFKRFRKLSVYLNTTWNHIDMFFIRSTEQKVFLKKLEGYPRLEESQLELTKNIISRLKPNMILVANAKAVPEYKKLFEMEDSDWSKEKGCYYTTIGTKSIPTHFSGQLTYLDKESFKRLKWVMNMKKNIARS